MFLDGYKDMVESVPFAIQLPPMTLDGLLSSFPILLLAAILTGSSSDPYFEKQAGETFRHVLADRVIIRGQKSLQLLQSLLTYMTWYHHRFDPQTVQFYQLLQLANGMVADLGLPRRFAKEGTFDGRGDEDVNAMRAFLLCYYLNCGGGVLGYDRPENMRCIDNLRNAAKWLAEVSDKALDKESPALVELLHIVSLHRDDGNGNRSEHRVPPSRGFAEWKATYIRQETSASLRSSYHFVAAYSVLKSSGSESMSSQDVRLSLQHFNAVLSNILDQKLCYLVQLGIIEWAHLITTLFLLARLESSRAVKSGTEGSFDQPLLVLQYVARFRALVDCLTTQAETSTAFRAPHLLGWLDKILTAVMQQSSSVEASRVSSSDESDHYHHHHHHHHQQESAYEIVNSFMDDRGNVRHPAPKEPTNVRKQVQRKDEEDFWTDFMSDWLNW
ncbi:uncharacterized protein Z519_11232 [Cladophialophora bantiana CBS 173.52]|uniref:Transcription factor domain-containing protein n=1 Tax=Cladophialophora bantiana (strain ATCC 10958 / CBS 173.52 / CDC B-1940 / NIH 8579) TaxID=1442370 RepID=A0A0D2EDD5_CLAB1|nr:uncharacterized protein Z519_11232 [Cladophialophora bantiana CBS 173.52]KIW88121.1 hypothetical protein Z519_11232 [Cladophialophora bantiana CBS 173.52]